VNGGKFKFVVRPRDTNLGEENENFGGRVSLNDDVFSFNDDVFSFNVDVFSFNGNVFSFNEDVEESLLEEVKKFECIVCWTGIGRLLTGSTEEGFGLGSRLLDSLGSRLWASLSCM